jgi:hypothetical protein
LEKAVDSGADFGGVGGLGILAVGDVERIESHSGLFGGALVGESNIFGVIGDALEHTQGDGLIVWHGCETFGDALRQRRCSRCCGD